VSQRMVKMRGGSCLSAGMRALVEIKPIRHFLLLFLFPHPPSLPPPLPPLPRRYYLLAGLTSIFGVGGREENHDWEAAFCPGR
jgi:hypothetical protein